MAEIADSKNEAGKKNKSGLRAAAGSLKPSVQIGKSGMTDQVLMEMKKQLAVRGIIKVKFLRPFLSQHNRKEAAAELASRTGSELVGLTGFTAVYHKEKKESAAAGNRNPALKSPKSTGNNTKKMHSP